MSWAEVIEERIVDYDVTIIQKPTVSDPRFRLKIDEKIYHVIYNPISKRCSMYNDHRLHIGDFEAVANMIGLAECDKSILPVEEVCDGQQFVKKNGSVRYRKVSDSSVKYFKLDNKSVYGIARHGNMTEVKHGTLVSLYDQMSEKDKKKTI